jgi:hypothetical protein
MLRRLDELQKNLEIEGTALAGVFKKNQAEENRVKSNSQKQTVSQLTAANKMLKQQNKQLKEKEMLNREALQKQAAKKGVRNWAEGNMDLEVVGSDEEFFNVRAPASFSRESPVRPNSRSPQKVRDYRIKTAEGPKPLQSTRIEGAELII